MLQQLFLCLSLLFVRALHSIEIDALKNALFQEKAPFNYPLNVHIIPGTANDEAVLLCCHGYGGNYSIADVIASQRVTNEHLVSFNFPDYDIFSRSVRKESYGTIQELLPALYVLKRIVADGKAASVSLYGFSAGGGAVVNIVGVLNTSDYDRQLNSLEITLSDKQAILKAIEKGIVLLDAPIKSGMNSSYAANNLQPFDALEKWQGLALSVALFIQDPDEAISGHNNEAFSQRLRSVNSKGRNRVIIADEGGHCGWHSSLWNAFHNLKLR